MAGLKLPQNSSPSTHSGLLNLQFPQISRNISRKILWVGSVENLLRLFIVLMVLTFAYLVINTAGPSNAHRQLNKIQHISGERIQLRNALMHFERGENDLAMGEVNEALSHDSKNIYLLELYKKVSLGNTKQIEQELALTKRVLEARPDYAGAWTRLALIYDQLGEDKLAVEARNRARSLNPEL